MRRPSRRTVERAAFVLSAIALALVYGYVSGRYQLFPHGLLDRSVEQAEREVDDWTEPPDFTSTRVYEGSGIDAVEPEAMQTGLTLITSVWRAFDWKPGLVLIDEKGEVVHAWGVPPGELFADSAYRRGEDIEEQAIHGTYLFPNGDVLVNIEYAGTVRMDACNRVKWRVSAGSHHMIAREDSTFWFPGLTKRRPPESPEYQDGYPGFDVPFHQDHLIQVSAGADILREINVIDVLYANGLESYLAKYQQLNESDPVHLNAVAPLPDSLAVEYPRFEAGDLLVSLRNLHLLFVLDPDTGQVKWHVSEPLVWQHDPKWLGDGWVGVFNNNSDPTQRGDMLGGSEILALDTESDSTRVLYPGSETEQRFYTGIKGKWQRLANGNLLLTEARPGRIVEAAPDGRTVWQWIQGPYSENEERVPEVSQAQRVDLTREDVAEWPCSRVGITTSGESD